MKSTADGAATSFPTGWATAFDYRQLQELHDALTRHGVADLVIGNSGALLHGFPDTTRDTTIFVRKAAANGRALVNALRELRFPLDDQQAEESARCASG